MPEDQGDMGFTIQQEARKVKAAFRFQINASLRDIHLLECAASVPETLKGCEGQILLSLRLNTEVLSAPGGTARFAVRAEIHGEPKDGRGQGRKCAFMVSCRYLLDYALKPGYAPAQEDLDAFKEGNAVFHCWPFFRELVQNLTMRMGLQIPPLPLLRLAPKPVTKKLSVRRSVRARTKAPSGSSNDGS